MSVHRIGLNTMHQFDPSTVKQATVLLVKWLLRPPLNSFVVYAALYEQLA